MLATPLLLLFLAQSTPPDADDGLEWLDNYQQAIQQAKATGKPIFLEYRCEP